MTTADGTVLSATKLVDHGDSADRWTLAIISEGYRHSEMGKFAADADAFVDTMQKTAPFGALWCAINVYRIDVTSTESGADDPADCDDEAGSGASSATYFDASFCYKGKTRRLLTIADNMLPQTIANNKIGAGMWGMILVIVNSPHYGGSGTVDGAPVAITSRHADVATIALHELGHSAFGVHDEYYFPDTAHDPAVPAAEPNVARTDAEASAKWGGLMNTAVLPTACNCCPPPAAAPTTLTIGAFEGGRHMECGIFRSQQHCRMEYQHHPFCAACRQRIWDTLSPLIATPATITLVTPSLAFTDVPEGGVTQLRDVVFEVNHSCAPLTLRLIENPNTGLQTPPDFAAPADTSVVVAPTGSTLTTATLTISYTSTTPGNGSSGQIYVEAVGAGQIYVIDVTANTVPAPIPAVVLVLDRSGSMAGLAGDGEAKVDKLRHAAGVFIDLMAATEGIGVVTFNHAAHPNLNVTAAGPASVPAGSGRAQALALLQPADTSLTPGGATSIGDGVVKGKELLDDVSSDYDVQAMVVLTDGNENTSPFLNTVGSSITARTFAIGLGTAANVSTMALNQLTQNSGGYLLVTGEIGTDQSALLSKFFLQILAGITNATVVLDPSGFLKAESKYRIPFVISEADYSMDVIVLSPEPNAIDFRLETPGGHIIDPTVADSIAGVDFVTTERVSFYRLGLPPASGARYVGLWHAVLTLGRARRRDSKVAKEESRQASLPYHVIVHAHSNLKLRATVYQKSLKPEAEVIVRAQLTEFGRPLVERATVWADVMRPDGTQIHLPLKQEKGEFVASLKVGIVGDYHLRVRADGVTVGNTPFQREQTLSAVAFVDGDTAPSTSTVPDGLKDNDDRPR